MLRDRGGRHAERVQSRLLEASRRLYDRVEADEVLAGACEAIRSVLPSSAVSVWITDADGVPRLAAFEGEGDVPASPPGDVLACLERGRAIGNEVAQWVCVPLRTARSGAIGAIHVRGAGGFSPETMMIETIARVTALGLETARLHDDAVEERERTAAILERVGDGVVVTDVDGVVRLANPSARGIFSREDAPLEAGARCRFALALSDESGPIDCRDRCALLAADRGDGDSREVWSARPDGTRRPLLASVRPVADARGAVTQVVHSFRDVTKLKQADEAKTLFLATASHELRTPLTVILGFARTLLGNGTHLPADVQRQALEAIEKRGSELAQIVDRLLLTSRIESGRVDVAPQSFDPTALLRERADAFALATGRRIGVALADDLGSVWADPVALATVVDHLLDNAVKYSPDDAPIGLSAVRTAAGVDVAVADEGIGMDGDEAARCFDKFWRADSSPTRSRGGSGIGLYIVRSLVRAMGGDVSVRSARGRGSVFHVSLLGADGPVVRPARAAAAPGSGEQSIVLEFMRQIGIQPRAGDPGG